MQRMLGIVEDKDDIAFENACWYLSSNEGLAEEELWRVALTSGFSSQIRCLEIIRRVLNQSTNNRVRL